MVYCFVTGDDVEGEGDVVDGRWCVAVPEDEPSVVVVVVVPRPTLLLNVPEPIFLLRETTAGAPSVLLLVVLPALAARCCSWICLLSALDICFFGGA